MKKRTIYILFVVTSLMVAAIIYLSDVGNYSTSITLQNKSGERERIVNKIDQGGLVSPEIQKILSNPDVERRKFLRRTRIATFRQFLPGLSLPRDIWNAIGEGRTQDALNGMLALAKAGDTDATFLLVLYSSSCPAANDAPSLDRSAQTRKFYLDRAQKLNRSPEVIDRMEQLLALEQADKEDTKKIVCPAVRDNLRTLMTHQVEDYMGASIESLMKKFGPDDSTVDDELSLKLARSGSPSAQYQLGIKLLDSSDPVKQADGVHWLQIASESIPGAKATLAICEIKGCPTPTGDIAQANKLLTEAALGGDYETLQALSLEGYLSDSLKQNQLAPTSSQAYAWKQFLDALTEAGCFGGPKYNNWAITQSSGIDLASLSPFEATQAKEQMTQLMTELPHTKEALECN